MNITRKLLLLLIFLFLLVIAGCGGGGGNDALPDPNAIVENGTVHLGIEDGYLILADSGRWYKPETLDSEFQQREMHVRFRGWDRGPYSSPWGTTATRIELTEIQPL